MTGYCFLHDYSTVIPPISSFGVGATAEPETQENIPHLCQPELMVQNISHLLSGLILSYCALASFTRNSLSQRSPKIQLLVIRLEEGACL